MTAALSQLPFETKHISFTSCAFSRIQLNQISPTFSNANVPQPALCNSFSQSKTQPSPEPTPESGLEAIATFGPVRGHCLRYLGGLAWEAATGELEASCACIPWLR